MHSDHSKKFTENTAASHARRAGDSSISKITSLPDNRSDRSDKAGNTELQADLLTQCLNAEAKTVLFTGATSNTETAALAARFADTLSNDARIKTLLIDCNFRNPSQHARFRFNGTNTLISLVKDNSGIEEIGPTARSNLYVIPAGGRNLTEPTAVFRSTAFDRLLLNAREIFNLVILDAPPVTECAESRYLSSKVDGVILVLEAETTRKHIALEAKKNIEKTGGKLLGVILNNVRHRIPEWLYRRI